MALFHDECTALVNARTGLALSGEELKAAEALLAAVDDNGRTIRISGPQAARLLAEHGWAICGNKVPKRAHICSKCGSRAPKGWIRCPECDKWVGNESHFCPHCNHRMHPDERIDLAGGVWDRVHSVFAQRFECGDLSHLARSGIYVQEGSRAILLDGGREVKVLGPGRHTPESLARSINWFGNPPPRSVVMVDSGDIILRLEFPPKDATQSALRSAEEKPLSVMAEATLRFDSSGADDFLANLMKDSRQVQFDEIAKLMYDETLPAVKSLCSQTTIEDLVKDPNRRERFEDAIEKGVRPLLKRNGLELVRIGAVDVISPDYEDLRKRYGELDQLRRKVEFEKKILDLDAEQESQSFAAQAAHDEREQDNEKERRRRCQEMQDYVAQLAVEKQIGDIERNNAIEIALKIAKGEITRKDAELERATRLEQYARDLEDQAHVQKLDLNLREYTREQVLADAHHKAERDAIRRKELVEDAKTDTIIAGERLEKEKIDAEIVRVQADAHHYETMRALDLEDAENRIDNEALAGKAKIVAGKTPLEMIALAKTDTERDAYLKLALNEQVNAAARSQNEAERAMSPEQLLARAAATSPDAAAAIAKMAEAKSGSAERILTEMKEMFDKRETHDSGVMEQVVKIVTEAVRHQSIVV